MQRSRTNIYIKDEETWSKILGKKAQYKLKSASDYVFSLLEIDGNRNIFVKVLLEEIEKAREYVNYGIKDVQSTFGIEGYSQMLSIISKAAGTTIISSLVNDPTMHEMPGEDGRISIDRQGSARIGLDLLHDSMIEAGVVPREVMIRNSIEQYHNEHCGELMEHRDLLIAFYPEVESRRSEIYATASFLQSSIKKLVSSSTSGKILPKIDPLKEYSVQGIMLNEKDLQGDLVFAEIMDASSSPSIDWKTVYGNVLRKAMLDLIHHNLMLVSSFLDQYSMDQEHVKMELDKVIDEKTSFRETIKSMEERSVDDRLKMKWECDDCGNDFSEPINADFGPDEGWHCPNCNSMNIREKK